MKQRVTWFLLVAALLALIAFGITRAVTSKRAQQAALAQQTQEKPALELAATDVVVARRSVIATGVPISGTVKATSTALVKARAAGDLQGLVVREGDSVRAGQVIARVDATDARSRLRQAQQQAQSAQAQVDIARRGATNNQALVDQGFISKTALDTSQATLAGAQSTQQAAVAAVDLATKALADTVVTSPIDGQVAQRFVQPGERVGVDTRIVEVIDARRVELEAVLPAADALLVQVGQTAQLRVEGRDLPIAARVVRINPSAQAGSRGVPVYLALDAAPGGLQLRHGIFVQGTLATGQAEVVAAPLSAVRTDQPQPYVQVVEGGRVVQRTVQPGVRSPAGTGGEVMVELPGLADGTVLLRGQMGALRDGTAVRLATPRPAP